jgi:hypothetical protein
MTRLNVEVAETIHTDLKILAAKRRVPLRQVVEEILTAGLPAAKAEAEK